MPSSGDGWSLCLSISLWQCIAQSRKVDQCPLNGTAWRKREEEVGCDLENSMFYHCFRDIQGDLQEECRKFIEADPKRGCPYFMGKSDLQYMDCTGMTGCPIGTDPFYFTDELYIYPSCLRSTKEALTTDIYSTAQRKSIAFTDKLNVSTEDAKVSWTAQKRIMENIIMIILLGTVFAASLV